MTDWGMVLKEVRKQKHWSVALLSYRSGVSPKTIFTLEGQGGGRIETYDKLFEAMGYELDVVKAEMWGYVD